MATIAAFKVPKVDNEPNVSRNYFLLPWWYGMFESEKLTISLYLVKAGTAIIFVFRRPDGVRMCCKLF